MRNVVADYECYDSYYCRYCYYSMLQQFHFQFPYRLNNRQWTLVSGGPSRAFARRAMLTLRATPLTTELGRSWRRLDALARTAVWTHQLAFEHCHCSKHISDTRH